MDEAPVEIVKSVIGFQANGSFKLSQCIVDLVEHHHAVASIRIILRVLVIEADGSPEVIHCFLVMPNRHECISTIGVILRMGGSLIVGWGTLETGDCLAEFLDGQLRVFLFFLFIEFLQVILSLIIQLMCQLLLLYLFAMVTCLLLFPLWLSYFGRLLHQIYYEQGIKLSPIIMKLKQSYLHAKVDLQPLDSLPIQRSKSKPPTTPNLADLFDWSKPSQIQRLNKNKAVIDSPIFTSMESPITSILGDQEGKAKQLESDFSIDFSRAQNDPNYSFAERVGFSQECEKVPTAVLERQMKEMRVRLAQMNTILGQKLNKYEMAPEKPDKEVPTSPEAMKKQLEVNAKVLQAQKEQIQRMAEKDKELAKRDYIGELEEVIQELREQLHDTAIEQQRGRAEVHRTDLDLQSIEEGEGLKQIKSLRRQMAFYLKKTKENENQEDALNLEIEEMRRKHDTISVLLEKHKDLAVKRCLEVSTNPQYISSKRNYHQLLQICQVQRKKKDVIAKSQHLSIDRLQKELQALNKDCSSIEQAVQQCDLKASQLEELNLQLMRKSKPIAYKFVESLVHGKWVPAKQTNPRRIVQLEQRMVSISNDKNMVESPQSGRYGRLKPRGSHARSFTIQVNK